MARVCVPLLELRFSWLKPVAKFTVRSHKLCRLTVVLAEEFATAKTYNLPQKQQYLYRLLFALIGWLHSTTAPVHK